MTSKYRYLIPNGLTFASMICGVVSILLSASGNLVPAGILILVSYILDMFDGALARKLNAGSEFGLQLDSLVDMVSLGMAPAALVFEYMKGGDWHMALVWPFVILLPLAGAFRLARFNQLPAKESSRGESAGLTISTGGATVALAVLSDIFWQDEFISDVAYLPMLVAISAMMVSQISFPSVFWVFKGKLRIGLLLILFAISLWKLPLFNAWFCWTVVYLGVAVVRAAYKKLLVNKKGNV